MRLINADIFEVVSFVDKSDEFMAGATYILEMIASAPTISDVSTNTYTAVGLTERQKVVVRTFVANDMSISKTAKALHYHRNSIIYQLGRILEITGLNPRKFNDLCKLVVLLQLDDARGKHHESSNN